MKKSVISGIVFMVLISSAIAFDVNICNKDMEENYLFSPGDKMIVQANVKAENADLELLYNNMDGILSSEMKKINENTFEFEYAIPKNVGKGNYLVKVIADDSEEIREIVIGNVVVMQFVDPDDEAYPELTAAKIRLKAKLERKEYSLIQKLILVAKNVWVNYIWLED